MRMAAVEQVKQRMRCKNVQIIGVWMIWIAKLYPIGAWVLPVNNAGQLLLVNFPERLDVACFFANAIEVFKQKDESCGEKCNAKPACPCLISQGKIPGEQGA
ncbi:MAG: hypothetical protein LBG47_10150 [Prevotellaceae bacterium]|nr:hypothetical protein [Prevotellaceae bacterium]